MHNRQGQCFVHHAGSLTDDRDLVCTVVPPPRLDGHITECA